MSQFSGKCDLYDHLCMQKMRDKGTYLESDEKECFEIFKQKTQGVIYQFIPLKLNRWNIDAQIERTNNEKILAKVEHSEIRKDKRTKTGTKEVKWNTYKYYGKEVKSLSDIKDYRAVREIHFDTLLDLIPYYPYIIVLGTASKDSEELYISTTSYIDTQEQMYLEHGWDTNLIDYYRDKLKKHYIEIAKETVMEET